MPSTVSGVIEEVSVAPSQKVKTGDVLFTYTPAEAAEPAEAVPQGCRGSLKKERP